MTVSVNPPKTPITAGSKGIATATVPNVCKMPGPPAPFVPTPLPNIARSSSSPKNFSKKVKIEGKAVAVRGASFSSTGDIASKGTGGGLVSSNTQGPIKFVGPGSMNVKMEGKNVQLLGDPVLNNCGPSGSPPNAATMLGVLQKPGQYTVVQEGECPICHKEHKAFDETEATKADAGVLARNFEATLDAVRPTWKSKKRKQVVQTMLGVAHCRCNKKYADQSSATTVELCQAAAASGMKHLDGVEFTYGKSGKNAFDDADITRVHEAMKRIAKGAGAFETNWQFADFRAAQSIDKNFPDVIVAYPPGSCAAQSALVLLRDDGGVPGAMTEQLFKSPNKGEVRGAPIRYIDNREGQMEETERVFAPGETVPPCGTCELLVPLLLCDDDEAVCSHGGSGS